MMLKVNGKPFSTNHTNVNMILSELKYDNKNTVSIINGYQADNDSSVKDNDELIFIAKNKMPAKVEFEAMLSARYTPEVYEKLKNARVAVAGLGGIGSNIAVMLARAGIGILHLIDFDVVEPSNLNRQQYKIKHLGMNKTDAIKSEIAEINPYIKVVCDNIKITDKNCGKIFENDVIVCEAFDKPNSKAMLVNTLLENRNDVYVVASSGMAGFEKSNLIKTRKITDKFYLCGDGVNEAVLGKSLISPRVALCAAHQANAVIRIILNLFDV